MNSSARLLPEGAVLLSSRAPIGYVAIAKNPTATNQGFRSLILKSDFDSEFVYYWLTANVDELERHSSGSTFKELSGSALAQIRLQVPPLPEQRAIAAVLGTLDDKIELNRRMNQTLEQIAQALFKSWFVDFDPVHANRNGESLPGLAPEVQALFPSAFEESELGNIPQGWRVGILEDLLVLQRGYDLPEASRTPGPYPVLSARGPSGTHAEFRVRGPGVTTGRSGVLGKVFYVTGDFWPLNTSLWIKEFHGSRPLHAYHLLKDIDFEIFNAGSAVPTLNRNHVHNVPMVIPPLATIERFEQLAEPLFTRRHHNSNEASTLAALRDSLLPKLMSGEVRVREAEQLVEEML
jgi:type I restriction enzyme, S subunit